MLFASDLHGSYFDMEKLLQKIKEESPDYVMLLGDFCGLEENRIFGCGMGQITAPYSYIRGNCDNADILEQYGFSADAYLCVEQYGKRKVFGTHGHIYNYSRPVPMMKKGDILVCGHTHTPAIAYKEGVTFINCGSMSRPRNTDKKTYAVIEDDIVKIKDAYSEEIILSADII